MAASLQKLYELNTPVYLHNLSLQYGKPILLDTIPDEEIAALKQQGYGYVWLMGIWERSPAAIEIEIADADFIDHLQEALPDVTQDDIIGSAYSIKDYQVNRQFGGRGGLAVFRKKLQAHGIKLILDFVPNHTAPDHPWVTDHPDYYITGTAEDLDAEPGNYLELNGRIFAKGRDPTFPAWSDVVQLNAFSEGYRRQAVATLTDIASMCDGVRCDMAMLLMNDIFAKSWGEKAGPLPQTDFWQEIIGTVRQHEPEFMFIAETYWDTEAALLAQGFDYCYDKKLYDWLIENDQSKISEYLKQTEAYRHQMLMFIENHDEERAAAVFDLEKHRAAMQTLLTLPGMLLIHDGQTSGFTTRIPVHLARGPHEEVNQAISDFYEQIL